MPRLTHARLRSALVATARGMNALGLNRGTSGNVSVRIPSGLLITPSGLPYEAMTLADIVRLGADGRAHGGTPSSEWRFHRDILAARADAEAVIHTHSPFATTLACLERAIPAFHYMVAVAGGDSIRCSPYATYGTQALSGHALKALADRSACLLGHHGVIVIGRDLDDALWRLGEVELLAEMYWRACQIAEPRRLGRAEMARVVEKFKNYGRRATAAKSEVERPQRSNIRPRS